MRGSEWWENEVPPSLGDGYLFAILDAIRQGWIYQVWHEVTLGDLRFQICNPLAVGTAEDRVYLFGLSNEMVDLIALEMGDVMSPTPFLYDAAAEDDRQQQIGPHTRKNGPQGMTKKAAKRHSDLVVADETCGAMITACCKTYVLHQYREHKLLRPGYGCEYGWRLSKPATWGSRNASVTGWLVQKAQYAHFYRAFWDYSMGAVFVKTKADLLGETVDLRTVAQSMTRHPLVAANPVPYIIHPDCSKTFSEPPPASDEEEEAPDTQRVPALPPLPVLRLGDRGVHVKDWQEILIDEGFSLSPYGIDGHFGQMTFIQTQAFQRANGLAPDGVVGPLTRQEVEHDRTTSTTSITLTSPFPALVGTRGRQKVFGAFNYTPAPVPSNPEAIKIHGDWVKKNIVQITIPQLRGVAGAHPKGYVYFHRKGAQQLKDLFQAWDDAGLMPLVLSWAGSWVPRFIRGSTSVLSNHAFGTAFDINAPWNPYFKKPAGVGDKGSVVRLVPLAHSFGFYWGGNFSTRPDGMHFEVAKVLDDA